MTPTEYHTRYGIAVSDLLTWIAAYKGKPPFREQVERWRKVVQELEQGELNEQKAQA